MTVYNLIDTSSRRIVGHALSIAERVDAVVLSIRNAAIRRNSIRELEALNDAQLFDIGIPRYAIPDAVDACIRNRVDSSGANLEKQRQQICDPTLVPEAEFVTCRTF